MSEVLDQQRALIKRQQDRIHDLEKDLEEAQKRDTLREFITDFLAKVNQAGIDQGEKGAIPNTGMAVQFSTDGGDTVHIHLLYQGVTPANQGESNA